MSGTISEATTAHNARGSSKGSDPGVSTNNHCNLSKIVNLNQSADEHHVGETTFSIIVTV